MIFCAILQFVPDDAQAVAIMDRFKQRLSPGSHVVVSHPFPGEQPGELFDEVSDVYTNTKTGSFTIRTRKQIAEFLTGTELLEPGLVPVEAWRNGAARPDFGNPSYLCGVGRLR